VPVTVVIDTNFIVVPAQFGIDIFTQAEAVLERSVRFEILSSVVSEIETLSEKASATERRWFRIAKDFIDRCQVIEYESTMQGLSVDDEVLEYLTGTGHILATNDKELKKRARDRGISVLMLRGKKRLMLEGASP